MGRFLSPDYNESGDGPDPIPYANPGDPQSLNLYSYARNNPLRNIDPDGHSCTTTSSTDPDGTIHVTVTCHDDPPPLMLAGAAVLSNEEFGPAAWFVGGGLLAAACIQTHCGSAIANLFSGQNNKPAPPIVAPANNAKARMDRTEHRPDDIAARSYFGKPKHGDGQSGNCIL